jgi:hypothetical protein
MVVASFMRWQGGSSRDDRDSFLTSRVSDADLDAARNAARHNGLDGVLGLLVAVARRSACVRHHGQHGRKERGEEPTKVHVRLCVVFGGGGVRVRE